MVAHRLTVWPERVVSLDQRDVSRGHATDVMRTPASSKPPHASVPAGRTVPAVARRARIRRRQRRL
jgi:hypothetical protein